MTAPRTQQQMAGRIGGNVRWSRTGDRRAALEPARRGFMRRFERLVDPEGTLPEAERARRAESAMRAHMARLAHDRVMGRRRRAAAAAAKGGSA